MEYQQTNLSLSLSLSMRVSCEQGQAPFPVVRCREHSSTTTASVDLSHTNHHQTLILVFLRADPKPQIKTPCNLDEFSCNLPSTATIFNGNHNYLTIIVVTSKPKSGCPFVHSQPALKTEDVSFCTRDNLLNAIVDDQQTRSWRHTIYNRLSKCSLIEEYVEFDSFYVR